MEKSDLAAAIANTSALSMSEAAIAVEFVLDLMSSERRLTVEAMPRPANSNVRMLEQLALFDEQGGTDAQVSV